MFVKYLCFLCTNVSIFSLVEIMETLWKAILRKVKLMRSYFE